MLSQKEKNLTKRNQLKLRYPKRGGKNARDKN